MTAATSGGTATPDFGQLADLLNAFDTCGVNLDQIINSGNGSGGGTPEATPEPVPTIEISTSDIFSQLQTLLTAEQYQCLVANVSEEDVNQLLQGQLSGSLLTALSTCNINFEDLAP